MPEFNFDFTIDKSKVPTIGILRYGITFNKASIEALGSPEFVSLGLDRAAKVLAVKATTKGECASCFSFCPVGSERQYIVLSAKKIRQAIAGLITVPTEGIKYAAQVDELTKMLLVKLDTATA